MADEVLGKAGVTLRNWAPPWGLIAFQLCLAQESDEVGVATPREKTDEVRGMLVDAVVQAEAAKRRMMKNAPLEHLHEQCSEDGASKRRKTKNDPFESSQDNRISPDGDSIGVPG